MVAHAILSLLPQTHTCELPLQPVPCFMNTSFHLSPHLLFFFLFSLCSPSPVSHPALLRSLLAYFCVSLSLPHFVSLLSLNDSASPSVTPPLCSPSLSPSFPPHRFLPPADDAWCDEDWLRGSQGGGKPQVCVAVARGRRRQWWRWWWWEGGAKRMKRKWAQTTTWESKPMRGYAETAQMCAVTHWHS